MVAGAGWSLAAQMQSVNAQMLLRAITAPRELVTSVQGTPVPERKLELLTESMKDVATVIEKVGEAS